MKVADAIELPGKLSDSLDWSAALGQAAQQKDPIIWRFDIGLENLYFPLEDEMTFQAIAAALDQFTKEVWPQYAETTKGAILYAGSGDFGRAFLWSEKQKENFAMWMKGRPSLPDTLQKKLFCADAFAHYFQMLSHRLPDEMPLFLFFDAAGCGSIGEKHLLFSGDRFDHFDLGLKDVPHFSGLYWESHQVKPASREVREAVCFPHESQCSESILAAAEALMLSITRPFRVIPEIFLTEQWEGIDVLYVVKEALTAQGIRKLKGFEAAGGRIEFRGRGI